MTTIERQEFKREDTDAGGSVSVTANGPDGSAEIVVSTEEGKLVGVFRYLPEFGTPELEAAFREIAGAVSGKAAAQFGKACKRVQEKDSE